MRIGLIDVDGHNFPNLALMKLSAYHKACGDAVEWYDSFAPHYDIVYQSKVFSDVYSKDIDYEVWNADKVVKGGTGYCISTINGREVYDKSKDFSLPDSVEHIYPDYSLYGITDTAYGYLSRGCPRGCEFCIVGKKEGRRSVKHSDLNEWWNGQGNIVCLDPNILACRDAPELLDQLKESGARVEFSQGLDARLITTERAEQLAGMKLTKLHFAMDSMGVVESVSKGLLNYRRAVESGGVDGHGNGGTCMCLLTSTRRSPRIWREYTSCATNSDTRRTLWYTISPIARQSTAVFSGGATGCPSRQSLIPLKNFHERCIKHHLRGNDDV